MNYSVSLLTTAADCDEAIAMAEGEKEELVFRKNNLEHDSSHFASTTVEVSSALGSVNTELGAQQTIFAALPAGKSKELVDLKIKRLVAKKKMLELREENFGPISLLEKENELARLIMEISEMDAFIAALLARKAAV